MSWEGSPEVCINGTWTGICQSNWNNVTSNIFCRQLLNKQNNMRKISSALSIIEMQHCMKCVQSVNCDDNWS